MKIKALPDKRLFAEICGFFQQFANIVRIKVPDFDELQHWLVNKSDVAPGLIQVHQQLLVKNKFFSAQKPYDWELVLIDFCKAYFHDCAYVILNEGGYLHVDLRTRLKILRALQDALFERSGKLAKSVADANPNEMRTQHLGKDRFDQRYLLCYLPITENYCIYCESYGSSFCVATNRRQVLNLIKGLSQRKSAVDSAAQWEEKQLIIFLNVLAYSEFH